MTNILTIITKDIYHITMNILSKVTVTAALACAAVSFTASAETSGAEEHKITFLLTGASFSVPENGWFEIACADMGAEAINKAVSGEAIYHTARRMEQGTFYTTDELDRTDVFVIGHVHNQNVANEQWLKENWEDYTSIATTTDYSVAYDYVIKRYIADCRALKDNPESRYYGSEEGKPVKIIFTTHWHDARTTYNPAIRKLAERWGFPLVKFDENIGFSRLDVASGEAQPSLAMAHDTETIGGVKYGWHPLRGDNSYIQRRMAQIFEEVAAEYVGITVPFDYTLTPAVAVIPAGETARWMVEFRGGHYPFSLTNLSGEATGLEAMEGVASSPFFIEKPLDGAHTMVLGNVTDSRGTAAASASLSASVLTADEVVLPSYESFVHQAEQSKGHADGATLDLKNGDGWTRRIYITFPLDKVLADDERIALRLHYESYVAASLGSEKRYFNGIDVLDLGANTSKYTANLTWDNHHSHQFEPVTSTILTQNMTDSYIGWDVTDYVKARAAEGAEVVTFRVTTPLRWRTLCRFTSSRSTTYPGKGPQMLIARAPEVSGIAEVDEAGASYTISGDTLLNPSGRQLRIFTPAGVLAADTSAGEFPLSTLPAGLYFATDGTTAIKFIR